MYRVFISSVQKEFEEERDAVNKYIRENPLLKQYFSSFIFEKHPAQGTPASDIYLGEVERCDVYLGILGVKESVAVENEFHKAKDGCKEVLLYVKGKDGTKRDAGVNRLIKEAQPLYKYAFFKDTPELLNEIFDSLILFLQKKGIISDIQFDESVCREAALDDVDAGKVNRFLQMAKAERNYPLGENASVKEALTHLNLLREGKPTNPAILLFGKDPQKFHVQAEIKCLQLAGTEVAKPFPSYHIYKGNVFDQSDKALGFVLDILKFSVVQQPGTVAVKRQFEIPEFAIQEAIVNAIAHRDYHSNAGVQVMVFVDRIEIWNPGRLPAGLSIDSLKAPHQSVPRNPRLCEALYLAAYVQKAGSGTLEMVKQCREKGLPEPEFKEKDGSFVTVIWRDRFTEEYLKGFGLNERQMKAVAYVKEKGDITLSSFRGLIPELSEKTLYRQLQNLVDKGVLKETGEKKGRKYLLK